MEISIFLALHIWKALVLPPTPFISLESRRFSCPVVASAKLRSCQLHNNGSDCIANTAVLIKYKIPQGYRLHNLNTTIEQMQWGTETKLIVFGLGVATPVLLRNLYSVDVKSKN